MKGDRISVTEAGWYHGARKPSSLGKGEGFFICGAAENGLQLRSRLETILYVTKRLRLRCFLHPRPRWSLVLSSPLARTSLKNGGKCHDAHHSNLRYHIEGWRAVAGCQHERRRKNYDRQAAYPTQCGYHRSGVCLQLAGRF